jgi:undecaprenyl-diphosphatase
MLELLHQFSVFLETTLQGISDNFWLSMLIIFLVCVGEAVFILGLLVPSLPFLLLVGGIIAEGSLPFWPCFFAATAGGVVGDAISYWIGYLLKDRVRTTWPFRNHIGLIEKGEVFFARHGGKAIFIGRFITGLKAVVPGIAGMMGMKWSYFTFINVVSGFVWAGSHILPGMLLTHWLDSIGLSLELVIIVGALVLTGLFLIIHYWKRMLLLLAPFMGAFGKSLQARWRAPEAPH